ncbi:hypothetical protein LXL04_020213 [Taraxacum kok-saghyz]
MDLCFSWSSNLLGKKDIGVYNSLRDGCWDYYLSGSRDILFNMCLWHTPMPFIPMDCNSEATLSKIYNIVLLGLRHIFVRKLTETGIIKVVYELTRHLITTFSYSYHKTHGSKIIIESIMMETQLESLKIEETLKIDRSIRGALIIIIGLYCVLWGKSKDEHDKKNEVLKEDNAMQVVVNDGDVWFAGKEWNSGENESNSLKFLRLVRNKRRKRIPK